jgi:D-methionine transport system ATP-binding protein
MSIQSKPTQVDQWILQLEQVSVAAPVGGGWRLRNISLAVKRRDRACIVGAAGSGKTTLLQLLNRLQDPSEGMIRFEGQDYRQIPVQQLRQQIVYVPPEPKLMEMRGKEAIAYPLRLQKLPLEQIQQRVEYWQNQLQLKAEWLEATEIQLGMKERQLIAITRALVMHPTILLLDNPLSLFDPPRLNLVLKALHHAGEKYNLTILLATHQLEVAKQWSQKAIYLEAGETTQVLPSTKVNWQDWEKRLMQIDEEWE